ncbi:MAG TPA: winged helix-turn-helix domain-containing protein [Pseudorhodoplanes sp.]|nr:winged helix-turn-helix domain-containing protein [Pseudorhodoplanes sp.]
MTGSAKLAIVAACAGDPARASMLQLLMDGRAFTAGELSAAAGVTAQTASGHLSRMVDAGLLTVASQGRHRYYRLSSPMVAQMLEGMMVVAASNAVMTGPGDQAMRKARSCYDHLAGKLGVGIAQRLVDAGHLTLTDQGGEVTSSGMMFFRRIGIDVETAPSHRTFCRPCMDWSERRYHLAGVLGDRIMHFCFDEGWIKQKPKSRVVDVTPLGARKFHEVFGLRMD